MSRKQRGTSPPPLPVWSQSADSHPKLASTANFAVLRYLATPAPTHPLLLSQIVLLPCMTLQHVSLLELRFWKVEDFFLVETFLLRGLLSFFVCFVLFCKKGELLDWVFWKKRILLAFVFLFLKKIFIEDHFS